MDIDMPGMNGMETARALRKVDAAVILIFVTNMAQFAISGYEVDATDFILKPVNKYSFAIKIKRAVARTAKKNDDTLRIKRDGTLYLVPLSSIQYLEVTGHYVVYHTAQGDFTEYTTLKAAQSRISRPYFAQCSQNFLINLKYLTAVSRETAMVDGKEIPVSRKMRPAFLNAVTDFLGGKSQ
jgi:DNA-binding LytR/AlgR family response regulator